MPDDKLPVGPMGDEARLPVRREAGLAASNRASALSVDMLDERREDPDKIDLLTYWRMLVKRRWLVLGVLATAAALSLLLTLMATPIYRATAVMQIDNEEQTVIQMGAVTSGGNDDQFLTTQYELLQSRSLAERVADDLALDAEGLKRLNPPGIVARIKSLVRPAWDPLESTCRHASLSIL